MAEIKVQIPDTKLDAIAQKRIKSLETANARLRSENARLKSTEETYRHKKTVLETLLRQIGDLVTDHATELGIPLDWC